MKKFQIVSVGDVVIDELLVINKKNIHSRLHNKGAEVCFRYGQKIIVDSCNFFIGGNAYNVSVGLARAGISVGLCTEIGDDAFSEKILASLQKEGIDTALVKQTSGTKTSFSIGIHFQYDRTLFVDHVERKHDFSFDTVTTEWLYLTNLRKQWKIPYKKMLTLVKNKKIKLIFNPGTSQLKSGYTSIAAVLRNTSILFLNKEEAQQLVQSYTKHIHPPLSDNLSNTFTIKKLLLLIHTMGPKTIIIADAKHGSFMIDEQKQCFHLGILPCTVREKTGAGDAYSAGFISAVIHKKTVQEAMRYGTINAISVITKPGPQTGLLSWGDLEKRVSEHPTFIEDPC